MAVDTNTCDRLRSVERGLLDLQLELQRERFSREITLTWAIAYVPIIAILVITIAVALSR